MAYFLTLLVVAYSFLASSRALHQWIHPDAASDDHVCIVTAFSQGHLHVPAPAIAPDCVPQALGDAPLRFDNTFLASLTFAVPSERAPPASALL